MLDLAALIDWWHKIEVESSPVFARMSPQIESNLLLCESEMGILV